MKYSTMVWLAGLLFSFLTTNDSIAQSVTYKASAKNLYTAIQDNFYIADSGYYRENAIGMKSEKPISYLWSLCAMVQAGNEMDNIFPGHHYFDQIMEVINKYKDSRLPVPGYASYKMRNISDDRFYDDNQWIGIAAMDAYKRTSKAIYLSLGNTIYQFMMSGYDTLSGGGIYWVESKKESKNTCSNGPGVLVALGLYEATKNRKYLDTAVLIYDWTNAHLRAPNGLYYDNWNIEKQHIDSALYSYNAGTMLESAVWLYQLTKDPKYLAEAKKTAANASAYFLSDGKFRDDYWFSAVLLRGYIRLYKQDHDASYIKTSRVALDNTLKTQKNRNGLYGKDKVENLVAQGGLLEMLCRLAALR